MLKPVVYLNIKTNEKHKIMKTQTHNYDKLNKIGNKAYDYLYFRLNKGVEFNIINESKTFCKLREQFNKEQERVNCKCNFDDFIAS
jgi:hypothetical protein